MQRLASLAVLLLLSGCAVSTTWIDTDKAPPAAPAELSDAVDVSLFLIGDTGKLLIDQPEPVLEALVAEVSESPGRSWILFLGDNIYPDGVPEDAPSKERRRAEDILRPQIEAAARSGAETIFIAGNHDHRAGGVAAVARQAEFINSFDDPRIRFLPEPGCPGPEVIDAGETLRLVLLDTEWWFAEDQQAATPASCSSRTADEIVAGVHEALATAGNRHSVVLAHHPLATHGAHGGFFSWREHLFPLVRWKSWLWVPIPILSSMYVGVRVWGGYDQDLSSGKYKEMRARMTEAFQPNSPLLHAGGHEHSLQILEGSHNAQWNLVSGAGSVKRPDEVGRGDDTVLVSPEAGYMRLDILSNGRSRLRVVEVTRQGQVKYPLSVWLTEEQAHAATP